MYYDGWSVTDVVNKKLEDNDMDCVIATMSGALKATGSVFDDAVFNEMKSLRAKTKYAAAAVFNDTVIAKAYAQDPRMTTNSVFKAAEALSIPVTSLLRSVMRQSDVMGKDVTDAAQSIFSIAVKYGYDPAKDLEEYVKHTQPHYEALMESTLRKHAYRPYLTHNIKDYFDGLLFGGMRGQPQMKQPSPAGKSVANVVNNLVGQNPMIAFYNPLEIARIAALATQYKDLIQVSTAMLKAAKRLDELTDGKTLTKSKFTEDAGSLGPKEMVSEADIQALAESKLELLGKSGKYTQEKTDLGSKLNSINNTYQTYIYLLGEELQQGMGRNFILEAGVIYKFADMPIVFSHEANKAEFALMRFAIGILDTMTKITENAIRSKDPKNLVPIFVWVTVHAMLTGYQSAVLGVLYDMLPNSTKEVLAQLDKEAPIFDIVGRLTGRDLTAPTLTNLPVIGFGYNLLEQDINNARYRTQQAFEHTSEGEIGQAAASLTSAAFAGLLLGRVPGANYNTARSMKLIYKEIEALRKSDSLADSVLTQFKIAEAMNNEWKLPTTEKKYC